MFFLYAAAKLENNALPLSRHTRIGFAAIISILPFDWLSALRTNVHCDVSRLFLQIAIFGAQP